MRGHSTQRNRFSGLVAAAAGLAMLSSWPVWAAQGDVADWLTFRTARFMDVKAAHPDQDATIADIKAKTAALMAAYQPPATPSLNQPPVIWRTSQTPIVVFDNPVAPRMIAIPAGEFTQGSPEAEPGRAATEGPQHRVRLAYAFAVSMFPVTVGEYSYFVAHTNRRSGSSCVTFEDGESRLRQSRDWNNPGYPTNTRNAAACVTFKDASDYVAWLSKKAGQTYRLLSEAEYEYVNRAGTTTAYWWGDDASAVCTHANGLDLDAPSFKGAATPFACHDGHPLAAEVGQYKPNGFGLFDTTGNVSSWTQDCWNDSYAGAPTDGSATLTGDCHDRVLRGGSFASVNLRAAARGKDPVDYAGAHHGFRIARAL